MRFYEGETLIRDLIPVQNTETGEVGFVDQANDWQFYGNSGPANSRLVAGPTLPVYDFTVTDPFPGVAESQWDETLTIENANADPRNPDGFDGEHGQAGWIAEEWDYYLYEDIVRGYDGSAELIENKVEAINKQALKVSNEVTGTQGDKSQYFKYTIELTAPDGAATADYAITGSDAAVPATAHNDATTNPTSVTLTGGTPTTVEVWLKDGQTVKIAGLPHGTTYKVTDQSLTTGTKVTYTNTKDGTTPTGILLQFGLPIAGIAFALILFGVVLASKRRMA